MDHEVGMVYEVPCAVLRWKDDRRMYKVPVFDDFHADPQFELADHHYNIDGRFEVHPRMMQRFLLSDGYTDLVIMERSAFYNLIEVH